MVHLRAKRFAGFRFRRQHPIGPYFADFCCVPRRLIIEVDGSQHGQPQHKRKDALRTAYLRERGYRVIRFSNEQVNIELGRCAAGDLPSSEEFLIARLYRRADKGPSLGAAAAPITP